MPTAFVLLSLSLLSLSAALPGRLEARPEPLAKEFAAMEASGFTLRKKASAKLNGVELVAAIFRESSGGRYDRLRVWEVRMGRPKLVYIEISSSMEIEFDAIHKDGGLPDLFADGSRAILYTTALPAVGGRKDMLHVLRYARGKVLPVSQALPMGVVVDLAGDGRREIVARDQALGQFFMAGCEDFCVLATSAVRATVYDLAPGGALVPASKKYSSFFEDDIAIRERELAANDPLQTGDYGGYLESGLTLYFDYAQEGRGREGWARLSRLLRAPAGAPSRAVSCIEEVKRDLRSRLSIPAYWPD